MSRTGSGAAAGGKGVKGNGHWAKVQEAVRSPAETALEIWVCRHGQTEDNSTKTAAGWNAGGLSATGITQATQLGERLRAESFDSMHVSDLRRTEMTANLVNEARQNLEPLEWIKDSRLREKGAGANEGKPVGTSERQAKQQGVSTRIFRPEGGGESWEDVATRARSFIRSVVRTAAMSQLKHRRILVVTHGGWIKECINAHLPAAKQGNTASNCCIFILRVKGGGAAQPKMEIVLRNDSAHIRREGAEQVSKEDGTPNEQGTEGGDSEKLASAFGGALSLVEGGGGE